MWRPSARLWRNPVALLLAHVHDQTEAELAVRAGFAAVLLARGAAVSLDPGVLVGRLQSGVAGDALHLAGGDRPRVLRVIATGLPAAHDLETVSGQVDGFVLMVAGRLLDAASLPTLAGLVTAAHERGLLVALQGGLEAPDVPRLFALGADMLLLDAALRTGGALDPVRCRALAALTMPVTPRPAPAGAAGPRDRIFVRDLVLAVAVGAYDSERGRTQQMRFSMEAELEPLATATEGMAAIVSYDLMIDAVRRLTTDRHIEFVETLAEEIAAAILPVPRVAVVRVTVEKLDVGPGAVGVAIERRRIDP